jgi:hypothetical protein
LFHGKLLHSGARAFVESEYYDDARLAKSHVIKNKKALDINNNNAQKTERTYADAVKSKSMNLIVDKKE